MISLFKTNGDSQSLETIKKTMHYLIKERNEEKTDSFETTLHTFMKELGVYKKEKEELSFSETWDYVREPA